MELKPETGNRIECGIAPWLSVRGGARAVEFYKAAFGAQQVYRIEDPDGNVVARLSVNGAEFWVSDQLQEESNASLQQNGPSVRIILTVADPDAVFTQAIGAGAHEIYPVKEQHGWRVGRIADPFGHHWEIARRLNFSKSCQREVFQSMTAHDTELTTLFLEFSRNKLLGQYWPRLRACVEPLTTEQIWWRPNRASNSIGNLILHLNGNVTQWLVASFNRQKDERDRPAEFATEGGLTAAELLAKLSATLEQARGALSRLAAEDLLAPYEIQGYRVRGLDAVYQVVEHFGLHYGQISYITKSLSGKDLGFYKELNMTGRAS